MKLEKDLLNELMVHPGDVVNLKDRSTESTAIEWLGSDERRYKKVAKEDLAVVRRRAERSTATAVGQ